MVVLLLAVGAAAYLVARQGGAPVSEAPAAPPDTATVQGGTLDVDSLRTVRQGILRRIDESATYLSFMLLEMDSTLKRWAERRSEPIRVYVPPGGPAGYRSSFEGQVRRAFVQWTGVAGIPVYFDFRRDSTNAEVKVRWVEQFPEARTGQADVVWDRRGWLVRGTLTLATHTPRGWPLDEDAVYTVTLHEIGHLLGLGHSDDPTDVMSPTTAVHDLTPRDRRTATLLYALPPGSLRDTRATR